MPAIRLRIFPISEQVRGVIIIGVLQDILLWNVASDLSRSPRCVSLKSLPYTFGICRVVGIYQSQARLTLCLGNGSTMSVN